METLTQFTERMEKVEWTEQFQVGRSYQGNTRSIYEFEGQHCHLESRGYRNAPNKSFGTVTPAQMYYVACAEPYDYWIHCRLIYGKHRTEKIAKYYGASNIEEEPYAKEEGAWFSLMFKDFEDLMKMTYDIYTGKFMELWGKEEKEYLSCIGD